MYARFGLTLVVTHACNLRCTYCYTGEKLRRRMPLAVGSKAIDRALNSLSCQGTLELAFFGGEPLVEAELILDLVHYARVQAVRRNIELALAMTTNGTLISPACWSVMMLSELQLAISHDGLPSVHDRHRVAIEGEPSSRRVEATIARLLDEGKEFRTVMVVRPDNVESLVDGLDHLHSLGVRQFEPSLDLWSTWTRADGERLKKAIGRAADFWGDRLPECSVSWFDDKAAQLAQVPTSESSRCGFGDGEIAVTPDGNLYPCERLVGADEKDNSMRLSGHVFAGDDFLGYRAAPSKSAHECAECVLNSMCNTTCRCSNYIRTRDVGRPDGLLCLWDQVCYQETVRALEARTLVNN